VVHVFKSTVLVPDYGWSQVRGSIHESLKLKLERKMIMKKTYWAVMLLAVFMGRNSAVGEDSQCGRGTIRTASRHQERGPGAWSIRRRLRLGSRRKDP
jgi:hypothetical protein